MIKNVSEFNEEKHIDTLIRYVKSKRVKVKYDLYWSGKEYIMKVLFYNNNSEYEYETTSTERVKEIKSACLKALSNYK